MNAETVVEVTKWTTLVNHIKNNRIEYILLSMALYVTGIADRIYAHTNGVCL